MHASKKNARPHVLPWYRWLWKLTNDYHRFLDICYWHLKSIVEVFCILPLLIFCQSDLKELYMSGFDRMTMLKMLPIRPTVPRSVNSVMILGQEFFFNGPTSDSFSFIFRLYSKSMWLAKIKISFSAFHPFLRFPNYISIVQWNHLHFLLYFWWLKPSRCAMPGIAVLGERKRERERERKGVLKNKREQILWPHDLGVENNGLRCASSSEICMKERWQ